MSVRLLVVLLATASVSTLHVAAPQLVLASATRESAPRQLKLESLLAERGGEKKVLSLRGGASLGPITPEVMLKINTIMACYFCVLFAGGLQWLPEWPFLGGLGSKKFGYGSSKMMDIHMGGMYFYFGLSRARLALEQGASRLLPCCPLPMRHTFPQETGGWSVCARSGPSRLDGLP